MLIASFFLSLPFSQMIVSAEEGEWPGQAVRYTVFNGNNSTLGGFYFLRDPLPLLRGERVVLCATERWPWEHLGIFTSVQTESLALESEGGEFWFRFRPFAPLPRPLESHSIRPSSLVQFDVAVQSPVIIPAVAAILQHARSTLQVFNLKLHYRAWSTFSEMWLNHIGELMEPVPQVGLDMPAFRMEDAFARTIFNERRTHLNLDAFRSHFSLDDIRCSRLTKLRLCKTVYVSYAQDPDEASRPFYCRTVTRLPDALLRKAVNLNLLSITFLREVHSFRYHNLTELQADEANQKLDLSALWNTLPNLMILEVGGKQLHREGVTAPRRARCQAWAAASVAVACTRANKAGPLCRSVIPLLAIVLDLTFSWRPPGRAGGAKRKFADE